MLDRRSHQPDHPRCRGPEAGGRGLLQVHHLQRAWRDDARLQHLRHRLASKRHLLAMPRYYMSEDVLHQNPH